MSEEFKKAIKEVTEEELVKIMPDGSIKAKNCKKTPRDCPKCPITTILKEIENCGFRCKDGSLELHRGYIALLARIKRLQISHDDLLAVLEKYSKHHHWCNSQGIGKTNYKCSCGLVKAIAKAKE